MKSKKLFWLIIIIVIAAVIAGILYKQNLKPVSQVIPTDGQPTIGNLKASVHVVAFEDLKCANCAMYDKLFFPVIKQNYIDTNKISYTMIPLAFIPGSIPAATAAYCLNEQSTDYFFEFVNYVYHHQPDESLDWAHNNALIAMAQNVNGANLTKLQACMNENKYTQQLQDNIQLAAKVMTGPVATPSLFVNGVQVTQMSADGIKQAIESA